MAHPTNSSNGSTKRLLSAAEAGEQYGFTAEQMRYLARTRQVPFVHVGRLVKFREADLDAHFAAQTKRPLS